MYATTKVETRCTFDLELPSIELHNSGPAEAKLVPALRYLYLSAYVSMYAEARGVNFKAIVPSRESNSKIFEFRML